MNERSFIIEPSMTVQLQLPCRTPACRGWSSGGSRYFHLISIRSRSKTRTPIQSSRIEHGQPDRREDQRAKPTRNWPIELRHEHCRDRQDDQRAELLGRPRVVDARRNDDRQQQRHQRDERADDEEEQQRARAENGSPHPVRRRTRCPTI